MIGENGYPLTPDWSVSARVNIPNVKPPATPIAEQVVDGHGSE